MWPDFPSYGKSMGAKMQGVKFLGPKLYRLKKKIQFIVPIYEKLDFIEIGSIWSYAGFTILFRVRTWAELKLESHYDVHYIRFTQIHAYHCIA